MSRRFRFAMLIASLPIVAAGVLLAQTHPAATAPSPPAAQGDLKISLMDGSVVTGKFSISGLDIETKFGPLKIPIDQIQSFAPGLKSHPGFAQNLADNVNNLAADSFDVREKAQAELTKLGPDIRVELERQLKTAEAEKQIRLQKIVEDFESEQPEDEMDKTRQWVDEDVIVTPGFTVVGHITTPSFSIASSYGTLQLKLEDIRFARRETTEPEEIHKTATVNGTAITQHTFTNTGIRIERGDKIYITAGGTITLTPWGPNATATPDGTPTGNLGVMQPGNLQGGSLIGKLGDGGEPFHVGSKATITADRSGVLELGIAVGGDYSSYQFPGEFQVKIRVVKKSGH